MKNPLRVFVTPPSGHPPIIERASAELGIQIELSVYPTEELFERALVNPDSFDLVQAEVWMIPRLYANKSILPIAASEISNRDKISDLFFAGRLGDRKVSTNGVAPHTQILRPDTAKGDQPWLNGVPTVCNCDTLGWRPDRTKREITTWGDLLADDLAGTVALADMPAVSYLELSLACQARKLVHYADIGEQSAAEIDATFTVINAYARQGQFHSLWSSFEESIACMTEGPVSIQSLWPPAVTELKKARIPVRYGPMQEGGRGWAGAFCLSAVLPDGMRRRAFDYVDWYLSGWSGAYLMRQGYYSSAPASAQRFLSDNEWRYWQLGQMASEAILAPDGVPIGDAGDSREGGSFEDRMLGIACWNTHMAEEPLLRRKWSEFRELVKGYG